MTEDRLPDDTGLFFANRTFTEIQQLINGPRKVVLLLPVGSTEPHGPHSPLSTDVVISMAICLRVARLLREDPQLQALILPDVGYGVTRFTKAFAGAIHIEEDTLAAVLRDICCSLIDQGLVHIAFVNNHFEPEHVKTLHRAMDEVEQRTGRVVGYLDLTRRRRAARLTAEVREGGSHAGRYETSIVMAERPELIDGAVLGSLPPTPVNLARAIGEGCKDFVEMGLPQAYNGSPADASVEEGRESLAILTEMLTQQLRELVAGTGGRDKPGLYVRV